MTFDLRSIPSYKASKISWYLMQEQALCGISFDKEAAEALLIRIASEMKAIADEIEPQLPPRPLKKGEQQNYTFPAKPYKKDGSLSAHGENFLAKHSLEVIGINHVEWPKGSGKLVKIEGGVELEATAPMLLGNQTDLKEFLLQSGWLPQFWNVKKDSRGKPERDKKGNYIQTTPKLQENGKLCPNLEELNGDLVRPVIKWLSLRNRESVINGWLANPRLARDGRLSAGATGITNTHRLKHHTCVNVPKAEDGVTYGKEMRSLFIPNDGHVLVGYDASALEARVEAHYCIPFPGGEAYAFDLLEGDVHMKTAEMVFAKQLECVIGTPDFHKDHPLVKPWRSKSKTIKYASSYGASYKKLAKTLGVSEQEGQQVYDAFWEAAKPLALLKEKVTQFWETTGEKKWIKGPDGRKLMSRSQHSLVNVLFQSTGAVVMEYSMILMAKYLGGVRLDPSGSPGYLYKGHWVYRVGWFHDEGQISCPAEIADEVGKLGVRSIVKAGEHLKLRVPMDGNYAIGASWAGTH